MSHWRKLTVKEMTVLCPLIIRTNSIICSLTKCPFATFCSKYTTQNDRTFELNTWSLYFVLKCDKMCETLAMYSNVLPSPIIFFLGYFKNVSYWAQKHYLKRYRCCSKMTLQHPPKIKSWEFLV